MRYGQLFSIDTPLTTCVILFFLSST